MDTINKLENAIGVFFKAMPHLPKNGQKWLATKMYSIQRMFLLFGIIVLVASVAFLVMGLFPDVSYFGIPVPAMATYDFVFISSNALVAIYSLIIVALMAQAIKPLQQMKKRGWDLLFVIFLVGLLYLTIDFVINLNTTALLINIICAVISAYLLYEIRSFFGKSSAKK